MTDPFAPDSFSLPDDEKSSSQTPESDISEGDVAGNDDVDGSELAVVRNELEHERDRSLRIAAEFENFRKRANREKQESGWRGKGDLVKSLLDALDDLARFGTADPAAMDSSAVIEGVSLVEKKILKALDGHGFERIDPLNQPFDPNVHEALTTVPATSSDEDGLVANVYQAGYSINGYLLRPARVIVKQFEDASNS